MKKARNSQREKLISTARNLARLGYSVIPVHGDARPGNPKQAAILWKPFQRRIARESEIERHFNDKVSAIGIVCGRVSSLMVLDFDDLRRYRSFLPALPAA